jgi:phosphatidylglycerol---prolipoprotein diacylglyceryl transferase
MRPTLLTLRGIEVPSYPAMFYVGAILGIVAQNAAANAAGLPSGRVYVATMLLFPVALVGARLLYVAGHWSEYRNCPRRIVDRASGGMTMYGGLFLMLPASVLVLGALDVPYWPFWDVTIFLLLIAMISTRVGCLLNGCCAGRPTRGHVGLWLRDAHDRLERRVPTQLLEALLALALLCGATVVRMRFPHPGELFLSVLASYAAGRLVLQPLRAEHTRLDGPLLFSAALLVGSLAGVVLIGT